MNRKVIYKTMFEYAFISFAILLMDVGIYVFKFPNHFAFGGVTGFSTVVSAVTRWSAGGFTFAANMALLLAGFPPPAGSFLARVLPPAALPAATPAIHIVN